MIKKINKSVIFSLIGAVTLLLSSCGYDPIFYGIMHDVPPESATINGNITSIARCNVDGEDYLFTTGNGALMYKPLSSQKHGEWKTYKPIPFTLHYYNYFPSSSTPEGHIGQQILRVISDQNYIYILSVSYKTDTDYGIVLPKRFYLWARPLSGIFSGTSADWTDLGENDELNKAIFPSLQDPAEGSFDTFFNLFYTNTPQLGHRKAFLRATDPTTRESSYYVLNGTSTLAKDESIGTTNFIPTDSDKQNTRVNSAFYIGNTLFFTDSQVVCTNETLETDATYACLSGSDKSYNSTKQLLLFEGNTAAGTTAVKEMASSIASLAITKDSIIIGEGSYNASYTSNGGIERIELDDQGKPKNETAAFTTNANYQFTSAYIIMTLLCVDPSKTETDSCLYASITYRGAGTASTASSRNIGLWSYYPSRGNWNRE
ncbi:MAG: hypothetical protein K5907_02155 [Treponema sp.]|nr:hypothetical protein [Treponema sp.]